jgi:DNA-binding NarL/FixJ family response regulator
LTASDPRSGIQTYKKGDTGIDLVILDYMMPEIDGAAALKEIYEINPDAKIVIASGYSLDSSKEEEIGRMARGFLKKPFNVDQMLGQIRKIIDEP